MSDLETRLSDALRGAGERAPHPGDLVAPARARLRRRRRTTSLVVAAAVAVAAPLAIGLADRADNPEVTTVTDGWRTESFRDLTLRVPADWGYQGGRDWCAGDGRPAVTRTEGWLVRAGCEPQFTYGVQFRDVPPEVFPEPQGVPSDAALELVGTGSASAWVVAESEDQLAEIVASVHQIDGVDANGCPTVVDPDAEGSGERVSVCRFDSGELEQSELLSVGDSEALAEAVASAPSHTSGYLACPEYSRRQPVVTLRSAAVQANLLPSSECPVANLFMDGTWERIVTEDVLYWALSPGAAVGSASDLPMPDPRRD